MSTTTTSMGLIVPALNDPSPQYVNDVATTLGKIDAHDHSSGKGVPVTSAGLNVNAALPFNTQSATGLRSAQFATLGAALTAPADAASLFNVNGDLYWLNGSGALVRLSNGPLVSAGIGGDYGAYPLAQVNYNNATLGYTFTDSTGAPAKGTFGPIAATTVTASGAIAGASIGVSGAVSGASATISGAAAVGSLSCTGVGTFGNKVTATNFGSASFASPKSTTLARRWRPTIMFAGLTSR